jgi:ABC-type multidrug transport system ATPase subunit
MRVELNQIGHAFGKHTLFAGITLTLSAPERWVILAGNGQGKSTLLQMLAGSKTPATGTVLWNGSPQQESIQNRPAFASPYQELIEELTLAEHLQFHQGFQPWLDGLDTAQVVRISGLESHAHKPLRWFSSGMKQRVKLCLALLSASPAVLLDEPTSNLDPESVAWYAQLLEQFGRSKLVVVASNFQPAEYPGSPWQEIRLAHFLPTDEALNFAAL